MDTTASFAISPAQPLLIKLRQPPASLTAKIFLRSVFFAAMLTADTLISGAQSVLVDFNVPGQYTNNFNSWNDNAGANGGNYGFAEGASAGVNGSGGVSIFQNNDTTATYKNSSWNFATNGATIILSALVQANGSVSADRTQFGILNSAANGLNGNAGIAFESYRFVPTSATTWSLREQFRTGNVNTETTLGNVTVASNHWYKFVIGMTNTSGATGNYSAGCVLFDYGTNGIAPGSNIVTFSTVENRPAQDIAKSSAVFPALRSFQDSGIGAWDNFLVFQSNSLPVFTLRLTNSSAAFNTALAFSALADGPGTISYSWYTNGIVSVGATNPSFTTPPVTAGLTNVAVVARNANGSATNSAIISLALLAPIALTGFNADLVIENTASGPPYNNVAIEFNPGEGTAFYQSGLAGTTFGLPASGTFNSVIDGTVFQFQSYTNKNALVMSAGTGIALGTLTLVNPAVYNSIAIIANSGSATATSTGALMINFADGTSFQTNFNAFDWFFNTGFALQGVDRIDLTSGATTGGPAGDPRFYQTTLNLAALLGTSNKPIVSLTFGEATGAGSTAVYAVSGWLNPQFNQFTLAAVTNFPATNISTVSATLQGQVLTNGGYVPDVIFYYGTNDGGANAAAWGNHVDLGTQNGVFSQDITGLAINTHYYFTASASNIAGVAWAAPSRTFTTSSPGFATLTNLPATGVGATVATPAGQVLSTGGSVPQITLFYGMTDGGTNPAAWANNIPLGLQSGTFAQTVTNLATNTFYFFTSRAVNASGANWAQPSSSFKTLNANSTVVQQAMLTYHNDNQRLGVNTNETQLTLANVKPGSFGKLFSHAVDGYVYAQPLVMTNVSIIGKGTHNVLYIVTEHESIYAFDADDNSGSNASPLWQTNFLNAAAGVTTVPNADVGTADIVPEIGITATPVIDPVAGTIYLEAKTKEVTGGVAAYVHRLHALDLTSGAERSNSPVIIAATNYPGVGGGGADTDGNGHVLWNGLKEHSRPALTLLNGVIYLGYASHGDKTPYHGWLFSYNATNLAQLAVYNSTPNGGLGGFWQGGGGCTVDSSGNFYLATGNGSFNATGGTFNQASNNFAMSVLKFSSTNGTLHLLDYFSPHDEATLSGGDVDLGSGAPIVLPDSAGSTNHPHLLAMAGKGGRIYLLDRDNLGKFNAAGDTQIVQTVTGALGTANQNGSYMTPCFFNNSLYYVGMNYSLLSFRLTNGLLPNTPTSFTSTIFGDKGSASPTISANGTNNAIVWVIENDAYASSGPGILHAYNATNLSVELYNSNQNPSRDNPGGSVKFTVPTVVNGKVYVGSEFNVTTYGVVAVFLATPSISPNGGTFTNSITVTLADSSSGASIYYTLDGSTPTTNSILYTAPFTLTNSAGVQAIAAMPGAVTSPVASAGFINTASLGSGTGLLGQYWSNHVFNFSGTPALTRTDAVVNFNWGVIGPDPKIGGSNYSVKWTGMVQPQYSQTYTFSTSTDDGVNLYVNGQLLINAFSSQSPAFRSASIDLKAQQYYNIEMDYSHEAGGGAGAALMWSSPSTPAAVIPVTQLYSTTNPPPAIALTSPADGAVFTASASVTLSADAATQNNALAAVSFYTNGGLAATLTNAPFTVTLTGLVAGSYALTASASDTVGLTKTSAPVAITVNPGTGAPYGLATRAPMTPYLNMPATFGGSLPPLLSQTGVFTNTPALAVGPALLPYNVNVPLWSDGASKTRWFGVPNTGAPSTPDTQIAFAPTGEWSFPSGTVFVKHFELTTDFSNTNAPKRRLETRLIVRNPSGSVYGVTYKWRADNSDADLLTTSLSEPIQITNADHSTWTQTWYYPSPNDCLVCHTPSANYVLGVKTRQLNGNFTYSATGQTDNQLRTLNHLGLFNPAINEADISNYTTLVAGTNLTAPLVDRARSYLDANCAQCHRPGGTGPSFDARYDTPLTNQSIINGPISKGDLGFDNAAVVVPEDLWRSILYQRADTLDANIKMPPLARNVIDTNNMALLAAWINSLPGTPALPPPTIAPPGGTFTGFVNVSLQSPTNTATLYYTIDGSLPTTNSSQYAGPFRLTNSVTVKASAWETGFNNSVAPSALFIINPGIFFTSSGVFTNGQFQMTFSGPVGSNYVLQVSTNLTQWIAIGTNTPVASPFYLVDPNPARSPQRFYRVLQTP